LAFIEDRYKLFFSRHCHCHLFLASEKTTTTTCRKALVHRVARGLARADLPKQAAGMARHVLLMRKCSYKRATRAPQSPLSLALLIVALLLGSTLAGASTPAQRLSRLDIAGHRRIHGGVN